MKIAAAREPGVFTLYREGVFWSCYNEDAMFFTKHVKPYKVMVKYIKRMDAHVFVVSFPEKVREGLLNGCAAILSSPPNGVAEDGPGHRQYTLTATGAKDGYAAWSAGHIAEKQVNENKQRPIAATAQDAHQKLTGMLRSFDLANSTPMQGMQLIQQLKQILQEE